jgi:hypothetical protein
LYLEYFQKEIATQTDPYIPYFIENTPEFLTSPTFDSKIKNGMIKNVLTGEFTLPFVDYIPQVI